jgi:TDG/mug DNA glycosylase family protein
MLDDILEEGLRLVVCGTAAGSASAQVGHYYAGPGNKFWRTLADIGLTPRQLAPDEAPLLPHFGIGLTDLVKEQSGPDSEIEFDPRNPADLTEKMLRYRPGILCFNGKRAAQQFLGDKRLPYGLLTQRIGRTSLFVAPSTSAAANGFWDLARWQDVAELVGMPLGREAAASKTAL